MVGVKSNFHTRQIISLDSGCFQVAKLSPGLYQQMVTDLTRFGGHLYTWSNFREEMFTDAEYEATVSC